jgi:hypothetical protein
MICSSPLDGRRLLDGAGGLVVADNVADAERAVEDDRQRREQVGEHALRRQADRDAADAEARDQAGHVHPDIVEHDDQRDREQREGDEQADEPERGAERGMGVAFGAAFDRAEDDLARPQRPLEHRRDGEQEADRGIDRGRRIGIAGDDPRGDEHDEDVARLGDRTAEDQPPARRQLRALAQPHPDSAQHVQRDDDRRADPDRDQHLQPVGTDPAIAVDDEGVGMRLHVLDGDRLGGGGGGVGRGRVTHRRILQAASVCPLGRPSSSSAISPRSKRDR